MFDFNSSKVRYKLNLSQTTITHREHFNSSKVRYKHTLINIGKVEPTKFQFLQGTVQTSSSSLEFVCRGSYFNSSKVRYKPCVKLLIASLTNVDFNSSKVRYKLKFSLKIAKQKKYFNSSKVRYKPENLRAFIKAYGVFQFLQGTVQTMGVLPPPLKEYLFQFLQGTVQTIFEKQEGDLTIQDFNSSKVRYKPGNNTGCINQC